MDSFGKHVLGKITSGRWIATILLISTFCWLTNKSLNLFIQNISNPTLAPILEKIAMFMLGSFCTQVANVITGYFNRTDRTELKQETKPGEVAK